MARRIAHAEWTGELASGRGEVSIGGEHMRLAYLPAWLQEGPGTNPEELLAAAHAASFAMALQAAFSRADRRAHVIRARAELHLDHRDGEWTITRCDLEGQVALQKQASARDMFRSEFDRIAEGAAASCPVSRALAGVEITVDVEPVSPDAGAESSPAEPRPAPSPAERWGAGRERRALEGRVMSGIRSRSRRRRSSAAGRSPALANPRLSSPLPTGDEGSG
jgi:lipoyl-dependent peroxiredoxin